MSAPLSPVGTGCCQPACNESSSTPIPGPKGDPGSNGTNGNDGKNSYTTTAANFVVPAVSATVSVAVVSSAWAANGQIVFVSTAGYYTVSGIPDSTHLTLTNLGYTGNAAPAAVITAPQAVSPGGLKGTDGSSGSTTLNQISPTTTKGDLIGDNGANSPSASNVRLAVGTNGKALVADSTQPTGLRYATITPNSATDNSIPRFDGATGTPIPLQSSNLIITDDGAIQSTPSGGNARGSKATDLQIDRALATQVASGTNSVVAGGLNNTASGSGSAVLSGTGNTASNVNCTVAGGTGNLSNGIDAFIGGGSGNTVNATNASVVAGSSNIASGTSACVAGGTGNVASAQSASVLGGSTNTASGVFSVVPGGTQGKAYLRGQEAFACSTFNGVQGSCQRSKLLANATTTDATPLVLLINATNALVVPINTAWSFTGIVLGRSDAGVCGFYLVSGGIKNNAGVISLIGSPTVATAVADGGWPGGAAVGITADAINLALSVTVTGAAATNIAWNCSLDLIEVGF